MIKSILSVMLVCLTLLSCDELAKMGIPLSEADVANGLKQALIQGVNRGSGSLFATETNGNSSLLNAMLPTEVKDVLSVARNLGFGPKIDNVSKTLNTAAVNSVKNSVPVFVNAITSMNISDAWGVLRGDKSAATTFLRKATAATLPAVIKPEVGNVFTSLGLKTSLLSNLGVKNPLLNDLDIDMSGLLTNMITTKMYDKVQEEEARIRTDIGARSTDLMRRVFAAAEPMVR
jgi:hypothetical protein